MNEKLAQHVGELVDQLVSVQIFMGGGGSAYATAPTVLSLYEAARRQTESPLSYAAARGLLENVGPKDYVIVSTGFIVPPVMVPEADGPIGAATLARALSRALDASVIILTEQWNIQRMASLFRTAGLNVAEDPESGQRYPKQVLLLPFPVDAQTAKNESQEILDRFNPKAVITIEKPSRNRVGEYHNGAGINMSPCVAKIDELIEVSRQRGIFTVGIGDGGNEIGMGSIEETVREVIPTGSACGCPCEGGIAAHTATDVCVVASVANWGTYGIEAVLAAALEDPSILHSVDVEQRVLDEAARQGFVDPTTCYSDGYVDGLPGRASRNVVDQLNIMLEARLASGWRAAAFREMMGEREAVQRVVDAW